MPHDQLFLLRADFADLTLHAGEFEDHRSVARMLALEPQGIGQQRIFDHARGEHLLGQTKHVNTLETARKALFGGADEDLTVWGRGIASEYLAEPAPEQMPHIRQAHGPHTFEGPKLRQELTHGLRLA